MVVPLTDLVLVVLIQQLTKRFAVTHRLTGNRETQILRRLVLDLVDLADAKSDASQSVRRCRLSRQGTRHNTGCDTGHRCLHE